MPKKTKGSIKYNNRNVYIGWIKNGKPFHIGRLYLNNDKSIYYFGVWSRNKLKYGQYIDKLNEKRFFVFNRVVFVNIVHDLCAICFESQQNIDYVLLSCGHSYCFTCIRTWFYTSNTCPSCRNIENDKIHKSLISSTKKLFTEKPILIDLVD